MDLDPNSEPDLYRDPDRSSRPVPPPRIRSNPDIKPGFRHGPDSDVQKDAERVELSGKQLLNKWKSWEQNSDPEAVLHSRRMPKPWIRPGLKEQMKGLSTEKTQSDPGPEPETLKKDESLDWDTNFKGHPQTSSDPEPVLQSRPMPKPWTRPRLKEQMKSVSTEKTHPQTRPGERPVPPPKPRPKPESPLSPEPSFEFEPQSLRSDLEYRGSEPALEPLQNRRSKFHNVDFRGFPEPRSELDSLLDPVFKKLEVQMVDLVKQQLQKYHKLLTSESTSEEQHSETQDPDEKDSELFLNLTLNLLRKMEQEQLADLLQTKSSSSVYQGKLKPRLQQRFSQVFEGVAKAGNAVPLDQIYTELYITEGEATEINQKHEIRYIESVSRKPAAPETTITCEDIFKPHPTHRQGPVTAEKTEQGPIRTVLTKGVAGVGKTVLTQKFSLDWAEGRANKDIQLLFPFTFRELNALRGTEYSLVGLLQHCFSETKELCRIEHFQVLFIFDGLDECRLTLDFSRSQVLTEPTERVPVEVLLVNLIRGNLLPSARVWITTRPAAANHIPAEYVSMVTEVRGFTDTQKEQYFRKRFKDEQKARVVITHIKKSRTLYHMCFIPVFCWMLSTVLQKIMEVIDKTALPQTLTEMYIHFLVVQAKVKNIKYSGRSGSDLHWTPDTKDMVGSLAKLAFEQLQKGNLIFYESDLSECGLDAAEIARYSGVFTEVFKEEPGLYQNKVYCFIHLSVQEFLAALHVHQTFFNTGENLLVEDDAHCSEEPTQFYKSAVDTCVRCPNGQLDLFLRFLLGLSLPANQNLLQGLMPQTGSEKTNQEMVRYVQMKASEELSTDRVLNLFHCLNELQDSSLEQQMQNLLRSGVLDPTRLSPGEWAALVFLLLSSDRDLELFDLRKYCPSENALLRLLPVLQASTKAKLSGCYLTSRCCSSMGSILAGSSLKELDLSNNDLQDSGVEQLCEGLKSATCELQTLRLSICNLTSRCCLVLGSVLVASSLKELDLSDNDLQDSGAEHLCKGLKSTTCGLQTLRLAGCVLTKKGCSSLAAALSANPSHLQELDLSYNSIESAGIKLLSALRENRDYRLTTLKFDFWDKWWMIPGLAKYSCEFTMDLTTANSELKIDQEETNVVFTEECQNYPQHPQRFDWYPQVLCSLKTDEPGTDSAPSTQPGPFLSGRNYWEIEWSGGVAIAVTDSSIRRRGDNRSCVFGWNDHSWRLWCSEGRYAVCHNSKQQVLSVVPSGSKGRVGVLLDTRAGILSFYEVKADPKGDHRTHLHTFHDRFPPNLLPGIGFGLRSYDSKASICGMYFEVVNSH